jgi:hypothetical protein
MFRYDCLPLIQRRGWQLRSGDSNREIVKDADDGKPAISHIVDLLLALRERAANQRF